MKILIAEDDPVVRKMVEHLMTAAGNDIIVASDGVEAYELALREQPDIVLTDWLMPGLDGEQLCQRLRSTGPGRPYIYIILLTVRDAKEDISRGLEAGADDYVVKPFDPSELMARLHVGERIVRLEAVLRHRNEELEQLLQTVRQLKSLLPICMFCKKVRTDENYWQQIETYIHEHTGTDFSHGVCPECFRKHYPEQYRRMQEEKKRGQEQEAARDESP